MMRPPKTGGIMTLRDYLHVNRMKTTHMARQLGISNNYMQMIKSERARPSLELASRIEILTGGQVTVNELRKEKC
jgi:DNA-binding transcriptional regulator YdaS (Cro superfamily)